METFTKIISFLLIASVFLSPFFILRFLDRINVKRKLVLYSVSGIILTFILFIIMGWWGHVSTDLLLSHYGYDFNALNYAERSESVSPENMHRVEILQKGRMGVGWPLKVIFAYALFSPGLCILYALTYCLKSRKKT